MKDFFKNLQVLRQDKVPVEILLESPAKLELLSKKGIPDKFIYDKNLYRPQLALAGYVGLFNYKQVQVFGNTEVYYLKSLAKEDAAEAFDTLCQFPIPCIVIANNAGLDPELIEIADNYDIPVFKTAYDTTRLYYLLSEFLDDQFAQQAVVHGSFVDVHGVGILFVGKSGIGKSEIALDLIERGHRLVADDIVMLTQKRESILMGAGTSLVQHFMEIRGLGIIDIRQMFGVRSIRFQKRLEIIVKLEEWKPEHQYTRTGLDENNLNLLGVDISSVTLPIFPGKNITVIAEVIAINYLLRTYGYNASKIFSEKLTDTIHKQSGPSETFKNKRIISYFQSDDE